MKRLFVLIVGAFLIQFSHISYGALGCSGRMFNPVTDTCWTCFFPITIGGAKIGKGFDDFAGTTPPPICTCPAPPPIFERIGIGMTYWSPDRLTEIVKKPMCSPTFGGKVLGKLPTTQGGTPSSDTVQRKSQGSFYHVHWMVMPLLQQFAMVVDTGLCMKQETMDFMFLSEVDPLWNDDELSLIMSPEALLFSSLPAQVSCAADSAKALVTNFGLDPLFWCSGGQGSLYPLTGNKQYHDGGPDTALGLTHRLAFTLHRLGMEMDTSTVAAMCFNIPQPIMRKGQYKAAFIQPIPSRNRAYGFGVPNVLFHAGREFPYKGEDYSLMVWRRKTCCAL
ncbi:MAG TPA: TraU family protein [Agitococcus sp.]|nr:TraU family protein [Agitococcus sp.]HNL79301.1 TraU family protein [Agitococcus sp.]